jgi:PPP family 3-phenylpropionic acid transporter
MLGLWLASLTLPESETRGHAAPPQPLRQVLLQPPVLAFLAACFLMQLSHGPYYTFYTIYLETYGYSKTLIGLLWAFAVVCEIAIFLWMARLLRRFDLGTVLAASFALAAVRWVLIGFFPQHLAVLWAAQALHAATFGTFHAAGMQMVHRFFTGKHQHRGQAIYGTASFGVGGALGSFYAGHTWTALGPTLTYVIAAASAALAWAIAWRWLRPKTA